MRDALLTDLVEEKGAFRISAVLHVMGDDLVVVLQGGKGHIGAVGIAQPRPGLSDAGRTSATSSVYTFPGHKEDDIAKAMAQVLASGLQRRVVVVAGLHWDGISPEGIDEVVAMCRTLTTRIMEEAGRR
jgi:predicted deacylase